VKRKQQYRLGVRGIALLLMGALGLAACAAPATQSPTALELANPELDVLQTCAVLPDQEMAEMRGCYDNWYTFALDIIGNIDLATRTFGVSAEFKAQVQSSAAQIQANPQPLQVSFSNGQAAATDGQVLYRAGIGTNSLGSGIMSVVMVAGNNNLVVANTNVILNISGLNSARSVAYNGLNQSLSRMGIR
jgi:hypothetical protein